MEVGALARTPQNPNCVQCPAQKTICPTKEQGCWPEIPKPKVKTKYEDLNEVAIVLRDPKSNALLIRQCSARTMEGLWDFPTI